MQAYHRFAPGRSALVLACVALARLPKITDALDMRNYFFSNMCSTPVTDLATCSALAASIFGLPFAKNETEKKYPSGCYRWVDDSVRFNTVPLVRCDVAPGAQCVCNKAGGNRLKSTGTCSDDGAFGETSISDTTRCMAFALERNATYKGIELVGTKPSGCHFTESTNEVKFNYRGMGGGFWWQENIDEDPDTYNLCKADAGFATYTSGDASVDRIPDEDTCAYAASLAGFAYAGTKKSRLDPTACYREYTDSNVYYNTDTNSIPCQINDQCIKYGTQYTYHPSPQPSHPSPQPSLHPTVSFQPTRTPATFECTFDSDDCGMTPLPSTKPWLRLSGSTESIGTGPVSDHTSGTGYYAYTESSAHNDDAGTQFGTAFAMATPGIGTVEFYYSMYSNDNTMGTLAVDASTDGGATYPVAIWAHSGNQGNGWRISRVYVGARGVTHIRFLATNGGSFTNDMAVDDIYITELPPGEPSSEPTQHPTPKPSFHPTPQPTTTFAPSMGTPFPTLAPSFEPTYHPTLDPTFRPTKQPLPQPTAIPIPGPTPHPTLHPTWRPTGKPTHRPSAVFTPKPTPRPTFLPTLKPSPRPTATAYPTGRTSHPTAAPTLPPSHSPTDLPTPAPTHVPTLMPSEQPTSSPTPTPTVVPTTIDTVNIAVTLELKLSGTLDPTPTDKLTIKATIASELAIDEVYFRNFDVTSARRRLDSTSGGPASPWHRRLASTWMVHVDVVMSLAATGAASPHAFRDSVYDNLKGNSFESSLQAELGGIELLVEQVTAAEVQRHPLI